MSIIAKAASLVGLGKEIATPINAVDGLLDNLFTSDEERLDKQTVLARIKHSPYLLAMQVALAQTASSDKWTSRARPMVLYTFCLVFLIDRGILPMAFWLLQTFHSAAIAPPPALLDSNLITTVVAGVIGLGVVASRGVEKVKGVTQ